MGDVPTGLAVRRPVTVAAWSLAFALLGAHPAETQPPESQVPATASVSGRVTDAVTGSPIAGALLVLREEASRNQHVVTTTADGTYTVGDLPSTRYLLHASALGYVGREWGQRHPLDTGEAIELVSGGNRRNINLGLLQAGVVVGRVTTQAGQPVASADIEALRPQFEANVRVLVPVSQAVTDQDGRFRLSGLPPGPYYIGAIDPMDEGTEDASGRVHWARTFYPGATTPGAAERVHLASGDTVEQIEFALRDIARVSVRGQLVDPWDGELSSGSIIMSQESDDGLGLGMAQAGRLDPGGSFEFRDVSPGEYRLRASARTLRPGPALFGSFQLAVQDTDVANVVLSLSATASLFGRVELSENAAVGGGSPPPAMTDLWVSAPMANGSMESGLARSRVFEDGSFSLATPGTAHASSDSTVSPAPGRWNRSSTRVGTSSTPHSSFSPANSSTGCASC